MRSSIFLLCALLLVGCDPQDRYRTSGEKAIDPVLYIDRTTGCHYLGTNAMAPRISADGKTHMGCGQRAESKGGV